jgi:hypothetical protein
MGVFDDDDDAWAQELGRGEFDNLPSIIDEIINDANVETAHVKLVNPVKLIPQEQEDQPALKKSKRVAYSVSCTLRLSGSDYQIQLLPQSSEYDKGYRLNKVDAKKPTGYNVTQKDGMIICECADFRFRNENCKHVKGLLDMGMLGTPSISQRMGSGVFDE